MPCMQREDTAHHDSQCSRPDRLIRVLSILLQWVANAYNEDSDQTGRIASLTESCLSAGFVTVWLYYLLNS